MDNEVKLLTIARDKLHTRAAFEQSFKDIVLDLPITELGLAFSLTANELEP